MERHDPAEDARCTHRWVLGQPHQGIVPGRCRFCGAEREHPAVLDDYDRFYPSAELRAGGAFSSMISEDLLGTGVGGARPFPPVTESRLLADSES
ncbi:MAG TPA: hypothetical protein VNN10_10860 [Dehalococcoidia bacterium]|nr:hypothetical protein [Dehalococcoidia bacterium]